MEELIVLFILVVIVIPIALSITAMVQMVGLRQEVRELRGSLIRLGMPAKPPQAKAPGASRPAPEPVKPPMQEPVAKDSPEPSELKVPKSPTPSSATKSFPTPAKPKPGLEFMLGGKAASFAGIAILIMGIVFLVGYSIQQGWIGPGMRIILGLLAGGGLVGAGHFVELKNKKYQLFCRVLTGGGSALFYFCVFAAYGIYHLIGVWAAGAGLFVSALAVFGLSMVYRSQAVAVLGVLGAFLTPLLIGGDLDAGVFPLVYVALINVPVLLLGVRRKWQLLYNIAFVFTVIYFCSWLDWLGANEWWIGQAFAVGFFLEYAALGLLKLRCEQKPAGRTVDLIRLVSASLLVLGATAWIFDKANLTSWLGTAFLLLALLHIALAGFAFRALTRFNEEILAFLAGGLVFATLALPAQLDGIWVSLGWAIEGAVLAWFATQVKSRTLQSGALLLGLIGITKSLVFDLTLYDNTPTLFLNARFIVGLLSAGLLGVQGWLAGRFKPSEKPSAWQDILWWIGIIGILITFFADTFWTLGADTAFAWMLTSIVLLVAGTALILFAPKKSSITVLGSLLLIVTPIKILLIDALIGLNCGGYDMTPFANTIIWIQLTALGAIILFLQPRILSRQATYICSAPALSRLLNIFSLIAALGVVTTEILRKNNDWADMAVTVLWAVCALALTLFGMARKTAAHRYFGLILLGLTTLKVLFVDASELNGLERILAFIATGVLLLAVSFFYQRATAYFNSPEEQK